jgi:hypothetical protein
MSPAVAVRRPKTAPAKRRDASRRPSSSIPA